MECSASHALQPIWPILKIAELSLSASYPKLIAHAALRVGLPPCQPTRNSSGRKLEAGDLTVSAAVLARVLEVLSLDEDLDRLAEHDEIGTKLADARTPRPRRSRNASPG